MLPLPSRTHPKNQNPLVYTEELTHLTPAQLNHSCSSESRHFPDPATASPSCKEFLSELPY